MQAVVDLVPREPGGHLDTGLCETSRAETERFLLQEEHHIPNAVARLPLSIFEKRRNNVKFVCRIGGETLDLEEGLIQAEQPLIGRATLLEELRADGSLLGGVLHLARQPRRC